MVPQYREYANQSLHSVSAMHAVISHLIIIVKSIVNDPAAAGGRPLRLPGGADGELTSCSSLRIAQKHWNEGETRASFGRHVEASADMCSWCLLSQRVHTTVLHEQPPSAHQQLLKVAMMVVSTTFLG